MSCVCVKWKRKGKVNSSRSSVRYFSTYLSACWLGSVISLWVIIHHCSYNALLSLCSSSLVMDAVFMLIALFSFDKIKRSMTRRVIFARDWDLESVINSYDTFVKLLKIFWKGKLLPEKCHRQREWVFRWSTGSNSVYIFRMCQLNKMWIQYKVIQ